MMETKVLMFQVRGSQFRLWAQQDSPFDKIHENVASIWPQYWKFKQPDSDMEQNGKTQ